jgi:hypothetical protein
LLGRNTYISVCYPNFKLDTFQVGKAKGSAVWDSEEWVRQYNPRYFESWKWAVDQYLPLIDRKYCRIENGQRFGYRPMQSQWYSLGSTTIQNTHNFFH